jgi:hypothetical protein
MRSIAGRALSTILATAILSCCLTSTSHAAEDPAEITVPGVPCAPAAARCPEDDATCRDVVAEQGNVTEPKTGRKFFLDYACGLVPGERALFILNVHGIGGNANWQRHYFPALDYKDTYRLIVATGKSAEINFRAANDDEYIAGIIDYVAKSFEKVDLRFWLAGHSAGGGYSRSWMCKPSALSDRIVGSVSLAGGRIGGMGSGFPAEAAASLRRSGIAPAGDGGTPPAPPGAPGSPPTCGELSHIYSTGDIDSLGGNPVPETSTLAESLSCGERVRHSDIVDTEGGHVYDARDREPPLPGWGKEARPGTTEVYEFPDCRDGRVIADLIRLEKGHTEGLEPKVTEQILKLMVRASP